MSWKPEVIADSSGQWAGNALRFATKEEAEAQVLDLSLWWTSVRETRVVESTDPVNYKYVDGKLIELTPREFDLLYFFARNPGKVFSRLDLLNQVWGYQHDGYEHTVNTHINRLRTKVEADPAEPRRILTVWGRGYKLSPTGAGDEGGA